MKKITEYNIDELLNLIENGDEKDIRLAEATINLNLTNELIIQSKKLNLISIVLALIAIIEIITSLLTLL